jgi:outer membrane receptor for ferrienterochelin and colicins
MQARYGRAIAKDLVATATATLLDTRMLSGTSDYDDRVKRFAVDLQWNRFARHSLLAGAEFSDLDIESGSHRPPGGGTPYTITDAGRQVASLTLQDRVDLGERFSVTAGARLDDYDDVGSRVTPRLSIVWRASDNHIVKAQYAEGFRAPTFFESYGGGVHNRDLDFEVNATTELNYVYRRPRMVARATLFHSDLKDMIFGGLPGGRFGNTREASAEGVELEWTQQLGEVVKLVANAAFVDTEENRGPTLNVHESESAADWMSDLALLVRPLPKTIVALHWNHVGERQVPANGEAYDALDLTATRQDLFLHGLSVRAGLKNALGEQIRYIGVRPTGDVDALVYEERTWWVGVSWRP